MNLINFFWSMTHVSSRTLYRKPVPDVPDTIIAIIHVKGGLSGECMGVCQVCRTNHMWRRGRGRSEKEIGKVFMKSLQGLLLRVPGLQHFGKNTNIFFQNMSAKCVSRYLLIDYEMPLLLLSHLVCFFTLHCLLWGLYVCCTEACSDGAYFCLSDTFPDSTYVYLAMHPLRVPYFT